MNSVSERSRVRLARSLSGAAEGRRDDASDLCIDAELNSVSYLQLDLPPWQRRVSVDSGSIAGVVVDEQRTSMVDANPRVPRGNTRVFKNNLTSASVAPHETRSAQRNALARQGT